MGDPVGSVNVSVWVREARKGVDKDCTHIGVLNCANHVIANALDVFRFSGLVESRHDSLVVEGGTDE